MPGFPSASGTLCIPLTLDGDICDTGLSIEDSTKITRFLDDCQNFIGSSPPRLNFFESRQAYEEALRPAWLLRMTDDIDRPVTRYLEKTAGAVRGSASQRLSKIFAPTWHKIHSLVPALLYLGPWEGKQPAYLIRPAALTVYGQEPESNDNYILSLLHLFNSLHEAWSLLDHGQVEHVVIEGQGDSQRELLDITKETELFSDPADSEMESPLSDQKPRFTKDDNRPTYVYRSDNDGRVRSPKPDRFHSNEAIREFTTTIDRASRLLQGFFLLMYYEMAGNELAQFYANWAVVFRGDKDLMDESDNRLDFLAKHVARFLMEERQLQRVIADQVAWKMAIGLATLLDPGVLDLA